MLHALELVRQIRLISQNPVVATDVQLSVILHPSLELDRTMSPQASDGSLVHTGDMLLNVSVGCFRD